MNKNEMIMSYIKELEDCDIVTLWNEYCYATNNYDDEILDCYRLEEYAQGQDALWLVNRFFYGHDEFDDNSSANPNRNYFMFDGYGNIISFDYIYNSYKDDFFNIDVESMVDYIVENEETFGDVDIARILDMEEV